MNRPITRVYTGLAVLATAFGRYAPKQSVKQSKLERLRRKQGLRPKLKLLHYKKLPQSFLHF